MKTEKAVFLSKESFKLKVYLDISTLESSNYQDKKLIARKI